MVTKAYEFEFDPYGDNPNNKITKERHTITPVGSGETNFFIPNKGPFHRRSFVLRNAATQLPLRPGYDYYFGFRFDQMILSGGMQPIYGAIVLGDPAANLVVEIDYQVVGGEFSLDLNQITTLLANKQLDPRTATWSAVVDIPDELPAVPHRHNAGTDMVGMSEVVARMYDLIDAQEAGYNKALQSLLEHIADHANPHRITLSDLGIDELGSLVPATKDQAEAGTDNSRYMTALRTAEYCAANIVPLLNAHKNDTNNPHNTTKAQVGLGSVDNYATATTVEAQAGVATNRFMTPALTKAAVDVLAPLALKPHTDNISNPHQTTKAQVGLGSVPNYAMATLAEAVAGTSTTTFMSPYLVSQAVSNGSGQGLAAHMLDTNNPHQTTKTQVGLGNVNNFALATAQEAIAGAVNDKYMTPFLVAQALANGAGSDLGAHIADYTNPHHVTKDQVGLGNVMNYTIASLNDAVAGSSNELYMTPYLVAQAIGNGMGSDVTAHLSDFSNPHNTTKVQVGLGNVQNYGVAGIADINAMTATDKYVVVANLQTFLNGPVSEFMRNNLAGSISKSDIGLGKVQDFEIATDRDIILRSRDKYMTPEMTFKALEYNVVSLPAFTFQASALPTILTRVPLSGLVADMQYKMYAGPEYWQVRFDAADVPEADDFAFSWTAIDTTVHTGTLAYSAKVEQLAGQTHIAVFAKATNPDTQLVWYYGVAYANSAIQLYEITASGSAEAIGTPVAVNNVGNTFVYNFSQVMSSAAMTFTVKTTDNSYTSPAMVVNAATVVANSDNWDPTDTAVLTPVFGLAANAPTGKLLGGRYSPNRVPNINTPTAGVVGSGTVYRYSPVNNSWVVDSTLTELPFERGMMYYSEDTNELGMGVLPGKLFPLGTSFIPGDVHVGGDLTVDGVTYIEVP